MLDCYDDCIQFRARPHSIALDSSTPHPLNAFTFTASNKNNATARDLLSPPRHHHRNYHLIIFFRQITSHSLLISNTLCACYNNITPAHHPLCSEMPVGFAYGTRNVTECASKTFSIHGSSFSCSVIWISST